MSMPKPKKQEFGVREREKDSIEQVRAMAKISYDYLEEMAHDLEFPVYREMFRKNLLDLLSKPFVRHYQERR